MADVDIIKNVKSSYEIVVPSERTQLVDYAANELQYFLKEISGVELPVKTESMASGGPAFLVGFSSRVKGISLDVNVDKLKDDGVLVKTVGKDIVLLGKNGRGQLYSVCVLLERYFGVKSLCIVKCFLRTAFQR